MTSTRVLPELGERIAEDGPAAHHRLLQHLPTPVADTAPGRPTFPLTACPAEKQSSSHEARYQPSERPTIAGPQELTMNAVTELGTHGWVDRTGGQLTGAERRSLRRPLARNHAVNAVGRLSMLVRLNSGRRAQVDRSVLVPPSSALTRAAVERAQRRLSPALLNHSYRTFAFGAALGALQGLTVDADLLFAAALLHDTGLPTSERDIDFTRNSARIARDVAEHVGLSSAATETIRTAIALHHSPGVTLEQHPGLGFKNEFAAAFRAEAAFVPRGRAQFLRRYGAFDLAIKLAPFRG